MSGVVGNKVTIGPFRVEVGDDRAIVSHDSFAVLTIPPAVFVTRVGADKISWQQVDMRTGALKDVHSEAFAARLTEARKVKGYWGWLALLTFIVFLSAPSASPFFLLWTILVAFRCRHRRKVAIVYAINESIAAKHQELHRSIAAVAGGNGSIYRIQFGADDSYKTIKSVVKSVSGKETVQLGMGVPGNALGQWRLPYLASKSGLLYFGLDGFFHDDGENVIFVRYHLVTMRAGSTNYRDESPPANTVPIGSVWEYTNKSGEPDRRRAQNPEYKVVPYHHLQLDLAGKCQCYYLTLTQRREQLVSLVRQLQWFCIVTIDNLAGAESSVLQSRARGDITTQPGVTSPEPRENNSLPKTAEIQAGGIEFTVRFSSGLGARDNRPPNLRWLSRGEKATVHGIEIGGMVYLGHGHGEPSAIDKEQIVASQAGNVVNAGMGYYPAYESIDATARRGYLEWLRDGAQNPAVDIGYVFLYYYGLERRLLLDLEPRLLNSDAEATREAQAIVDEVARLLDIYSPRQSSFTGYAEAMYWHIQMLVNDRRLYDIPFTGKYATAGGMTMVPISIALGQMAVDGKLLDGKWASRWAQASWEVPKNTAARRCHEEFARLFAAEFDRRYPNGYRIGVNKTKWEHRFPTSNRSVASALFRQKERNIGKGDLPDVTRLERHNKIMRAIAEKCAEALAPYSRAVGKDGAGATTPLVALLLPPDGWPESVKNSLEKISAECASDQIATSLGQLLERFGATFPVVKDGMKMLEAALQSAAVGVEPPLASLPKNPNPSQIVTLFALEPTSLDWQPDASYFAARALVELLASATKDIPIEARSAITLPQTTIWTQLSLDEQTRLKLRWRDALAEPPTVDSAAKKLVGTGDDVRHGIATLVTNCLLGSRGLDKATRKGLERVYRALKLEPALLQADIAPYVTDTTREASGTDAQDTAGAPAILDPSRIAAIMRDTEQVSKLLANVFEETSPKSATNLASMPPDQDEKESEPAATSTRLPLGLDQRSADFLRILTMQVHWPRAELAEKAAAAGLMLDGVLERINDICFDEFDGPLTDGHDPITLETSILSRIPT